MRLIRTCAVYFSLSTSLMATSALAKVTVTEAADSKTWNIEIENLNQEKITIDGKTFASPKLQGVDGYAGISYQVGAPALPVVRMYVTGKVDVEFIDLESKIQAEVAPAPATASVPKVEGAQRVLTIDKAKYTESLAPRWTVEPAGSVRGIPQYLLTVYPLAYNGVDESYTLARTIRVHERAIPVVKEDGSAGTIAFVVGQKFAESAALQQYMDFKRGLGHQVELVVYGRDVNGIDGIRSKLKDLLVSENLRYAILVGDTDSIPAKSARHMSGLTDHYFRAIDTDNYETDINGPDIGLGRISVRTEQELQNVVNKYMRYQNSREFNSVWESQISFLGTSDTGYYQLAEGTHNYVIDTYTRAKGYVGNFPAARTLGGDKLYAISNRASGSDVKASLREGRNFVTYSGHGYAGGWAGPNLSTADVKALSDPDMMPFVLGFACNTADYRDTENFAEAWQRNPNGAILYLGSFDSSYWDEDDIFERKLYDGIFAGTTEFGASINSALSQLWAHYGGAGKSSYYWESYTTFGDPSISLRTGIPQ